MGKVAGADASLEAWNLPCGQPSHWGRRERAFLVDPRSRWGTSIPAEKVFLGHRFWNGVSKRLVPLIPSPETVLGSRKCGPGKDALWVRQDRAGDLSEPHGSFISGLGVEPTCALTLPPYHMPSTFL